MNAVESARAAEQHAATKLREDTLCFEEATARLLVSREAYGGDPSKTRKQAKKEAEEAVSDAKDILDHATRDLAHRRTILETAERDEKQARLATHSASLATWPAAVEAAIARLVEIDRQLGAAVLALARATVDASDTFDDAEALAGSLLASRKFQQEFSRPSIPNAQLEVRRALTRATSIAD